MSDTENANTPAEQPNTEPVAEVPNSGTGDTPATEAPASVPAAA